MFCMFKNIFIFHLPTYTFNSHISHYMKEENFYLKNINIGTNAVLCVVLHNKKGEFLYFSRTNSLPIAFVVRKSFSK